MIDPSPGVAVDWPVVGSGALLLFLGLSALCVLVALGTLRRIVRAGQ